MKLVIIALFAIVLIANAKMIYLNELASSDEPAHSSEERVGAQVPADVQNIPLSQRACTNAHCDYICWVLGFNYGTCVSSTTCQCYN